MPAKSGAASPDCPLFSLNSGIKNLRKNAKIFLMMEDPSTYVVLN
jgi:hypothetical protein